RRAYRALPSTTLFRSGFGWEGKAEGDNTLFSIITAGYDFVETMKIELLAGRSFSRDFGSDSMNYVVNERTAAAMGMENPVGQQRSEEHTSELQSRENL